MLPFKTKLFSRLTIYGFAFLIIFGSLLYSNFLARQLAEKEKEGAEIFGKAQAFIVNLDLADSTASSQAIGFIYNEIIRKSGSNVPKVLIGENNTIDSHTLDLPNGISMEEEEKLVRDKLRKMEEEYDPILVEFAEGRFQKVFYGSSFLLKHLRWFPFIQLLVAFTFIGIVFAGFAISKRNEQNKVWVGLAKETAHQLGTPISSLMAWIELLKLNSEENPEDQELVSEMERDVLRLENIAERFSKIGSVPELIPVKLKEVLDRSAEYISKRMTQRGSIKLFVDNQIPLDSALMVNPQLFDWVIENLLKNALDAIQNNEGSITIQAGEKGKDYFIEVIDTGKGIPKSNFKTVFEPGFTTKKRGWGLGLSLTKRIIENYHQGKIFVKSSEVNKGTTFRILLPKES
ncbi:MAG: HAMP domain-containing sensor histidine kinase [Bacteroidota bacterium]